MSYNRPGFKVYDSSFNMPKIKFSEKVRLIIFFSQLFEEEKYLQSFWRYYLNILFKHIKVKFGNYRRDIKKNF